MKQIFSFIDNILRRMEHLLTKKVDVYFVSGMCYNCKVFNKLVLPNNYKKKYIEWQEPYVDESLRGYAERMAANINTKRPFILIGYSFGAVIIQEMNIFLTPQKNIIISSFKNKDETPPLFRLARKMHLIEKIPSKLFSSEEFITNTFNKFVYKKPTSELAEFMTYVDPVYIKWSLEKIINWTPRFTCENLYHIHGTDDQIFPNDLIKDAYRIVNGDHLMVINKVDVVNQVLSIILHK